jgi:hypothetical protein
VGGVALHHEGGMLRRIVEGDEIVDAKFDVFVDCNSVCGKAQTSPPGLCHDFLIG